MQLQRSNLLIVASLLGLGVGIPLTLWGSEGMQVIVGFFETQGARLVGSLVVVLSVTVLVRQVRARRALPPITQSRPVAESVPPSPGSGHPANPPLA